MIRNLILIWVFGVLGLGVVSGQSDRVFNPENYTTTTYYNQGDALWINDTICYFKGTGEEWIPEKRFIVQSRDGLGQELETAFEFYDASTGVWVEKYRSVKSYYYFYDTNFLRDQTSYFKNTRTGKWELASSTEYDKSGRMIQRFTKQWDPEVNNFVAGTREEFTYDEKDNLLIKVQEAWDPADLNWEKSIRTTYQYGKGHEPISICSSIWAESDQAWQIENKTVSKINQNGQVVQKEFVSFDPGSVKGRTTELIQLKYDGQGNISESIRIKKLADSETATRELNHYRADGSLAKKISFSKAGVDESWKPVQEVHYRFSPVNQSREIRIRIWDDGQGMWVNHRTEKFLMKEENIAEQIRMSWNPGTDDWEFNNKVSYEYDGELLAALTSRVWTEEGWLPVDKKQFDYNDGGRQLSESGLVWDLEGNDWNIVFRNDWEYDESGNIIAYSMAANNGGDWEYKEKSTFEWHMFSLSKTESRENYTIEVFPNPTKGVLHIKSMAGTLSRIAILDQYGRLLEAISLDQQSTTIDVSYLPSGNYFIECLNGARKNTFKVVKI